MGSILDQGADYYNRPALWSEIALALKALTPLLLTISSLAPRIRSPFSRSTRTCIDERKVDRPKSSLFDTILTIPLTCDFNSHHLRNLNALRARSCSSLVTELHETLKISPDRALAGPMSTLPCFHPAGNCAVLKESHFQLRRRASADHASI